jgi:hypothetical protein
MHGAGRRLTKGGVSCHSTTKRPATCSFSFRMHGAGRRRHKDGLHLLSRVGIPEGPRLLVLEIFCLCLIRFGAFGFEELVSGEGPTSPATKPVLDCGVGLEWVDVGFDDVEYRDGVGVH